MLFGPGTRYTVLRLRREGLRFEPVHPLRVGNKARTQCVPTHKDPVPVEKQRCLRLLDLLDRCATQPDISDLALRFKVGKSTQRF